VFLNIAQVKTNTHRFATIGLYAILKNTKLEAWHSKEKNKLNRGRKGREFNRLSREI